jgi:Domain of unknown function (DUF4383)
MDTRMVAIVLGVILVIAGIIGFIPNPIAYSENAIFTVNAALNVVHIVSGLFLLAGAFTGLGSMMALRILGIVYVVVAILGFVSGDMILGFLSNNAGDNWLHVVLAIVLLGAGFGMADRQMSPAT